MIVRVLVQTAGFLVFMGALLFGSAGGLGWPQVWVFLAIMGVISLATGVWLASYDPGLLQERLAAPWARQQQPRGDRLWVIAIVLVFLAWFIAMGVERRLAGGAGFPTWAQAAGGGLVVPNGASM